MIRAQRRDRPTLPPVDACRVTNPFAAPGSYASRADNHGPAGHHTGTDYGAAWPVPIEGREVHSSTPGVVVISDDSRAAYGQWVGVYFRADDVTLTYWHMQDRTVAVGDEVTRGQVLGHVGNTGNSTAPHLHVQANPGRDFDYHAHIDPAPWVGTVEEPPMADLQTRVIARIRSLGGTVLTREQWGSQRRNVYAQRLRDRPVRVRRADTLVGHITVTFDDGDLIGDFKRDMREVERIGYERFGSGFSYNFGVDFATGMIGEGQPLLAKGTHTVNDKGVPGYSYDQNHAARAIAGLGMPGDRLTDAGKRGWAIVIAALVLEGAITETPDIVPHSLFAAKDCPTNAIRDNLPELWRMARQIIDDVRSGRRPQPITPITPPEDDMPTADEVVQKFLDSPLNVHDPKGNPVTGSVTVREALSADVIRLAEGDDAARAYLDRARTSPAEKE